MKTATPIPAHCRLYSVEESRKLDQETINKFGVDGFTLMELAGAGTAAQIKNHQGYEKKGLFICGKGNNAGDALVVARYLVNDASHQTDVFFALGKNQLSPDTKHNLGLLQKMKQNGAKVSFLQSFPRHQLNSCHYIIDGIFGTGLNSDLRGDLPQIVESVNKSGRPVYSMDVPSGLNADSGETYNATIRANRTFTFGTNKIGFCFNKARSYTGDVHFIRLPFPEYLKTSSSYLLDESLYNTFPKIYRDARHKYQQGTVHIVAGSEGLTGAAIMCAQSAWKAGAGAVILYTPQKLMAVYEKSLPQIIKVGVGTSEDSFFKEGHTETIMQKMQDKPGTLIAGPGVGLREETGNCIKTVLENHDGFAILDADFFAFWKMLENASPQQKQKWILTPHSGEAQKYLNASFAKDIDRYYWARNFQEKHGCSLIMKGNPSVLCTSEGSIVTAYETSMFSRAGFGDVLAGKLGANTEITKDSVNACVMSLFEGYLAYKNHDGTKIFGPEHLI